MEGGKKSAETDCFGGREHVAVIAGGGVGQSAHPIEAVVESQRLQRGRRGWGEEVEWQSGLCGRVVG